MIAAWRRQLPAYSPLDVHAVWAGMRGVIREPALLREQLVLLLRERYGARDALLVGSGTAALQLALAGVRAVISPQPIAAPAYCCYDIASAVEGAGSEALLYDIQPGSLAPEPYSLRRVLEREPAALVAAHLYGYPVDVECLAHRCRESDTVLIEDAAQAAGAALRGKPLGSFGSLSVLSFGRGKGTTAGAGGALLAHDETGERVMEWSRRQLAPARAGHREAVQLAAQWLLGRPATYGLPASIPFLHLGETVYHPPTVCRAMSSVAVRALNASVAHGAAEPACRQTTAARLLTAARQSRVVDVVEELDEATPGYLRLPLRAREDRTAVQVMRELSRFGVAAGYPLPLASLEPFRSRVLNAGEEFSGAHSLAATLFTCPTHSRVQPLDVEAMERWLLQ